MALRTYLALRLAMVAVIAALFGSLIKEMSRVDPVCVQGSISAYYYTPVRAVFVGTLLIMAVCLIALWGKGWVEDGALNLAGMLAPIVAFVPTKPNTLCSLILPDGTDLRELAETNPDKAAAAKKDLIESSHDAIFNNIYTYLAVLAAVLVVLAVAGWVGTHKGWPRLARGSRLGYWLPLGAAAVLWGLVVIAFLPANRDWFYTHMHTPSAFILFVFIIVAVLWNAKDKRDVRDGKKPDDVVRGRFDPKPNAWFRIYLGLGLVMALGGVAIVVAGKILTDGDFSNHKTFILEAFEIGFLALFWLAQTWDRRKEGAPK
jgi:hypothetical protein